MEDGVVKSEESGLRGTVGGGAIPQKEDLVKQ